MMQEQFPKIFWGHAHKRINDLAVTPTMGVFSRHAHAEWQLYSHRASYKYMYVCELGNLHRRHCLWERGKKTRSERRLPRIPLNFYTMHFIWADEWLSDQKPHHVGRCGRPLF